MTTINLRPTDKQRLEDKSGEAVATVVYTDSYDIQLGMMWHGPLVPSGTKLYLHPATVTNEVSRPPKVSDEDVERAMDAFAKLPADHNSNNWDRECMRAALESFVRPTPPASTKGG